MAVLFDITIVRDSPYYLRSVEIYCGLAFVYYLILRQSSTLIVHLYFLQVFLSCPLVAPKDQRARHAESPVWLFFVQELPRQYPSVKEPLPLEPVC